MTAARRRQGSCDEGSPDSRAEEKGEGGIEIRLNGEVRTLRPGSTLASLLDEVGRDPRTVAIERNGKIVRRADFSDTRLDSGDRVEIVQFVQGGAGGSSRLAVDRAGKESAGDR